MTRRKRFKCLAALVALLALMVAYAEDYQLFWTTVDSGGPDPSDAGSGGDYTLSGTIGQPDARNQPEPMTGGSYTLTGGFWVIPECPAIQPDYDCDCDVDQADFVLFEACASGPNIPYELDCEDRDYDNDMDVDQADFAAFQRCVSGENNPVEYSCAE